MRLAPDCGHGSRPTFPVVAVTPVPVESITAAYAYEWRCGPDLDGLHVLSCATNSSGRPAQKVISPPGLVVGGLVR